jgi:hypothetical protein
MKHYILYTAMSLCMFYLSIGEIERMSRAAGEFVLTKSRVKDILS